ncbi:MAG: AMP-binding protein [Candidatus Tectomicrobia bacterium]|nr:AMP-binding protein [Candidatus Tectomicrobia bacterium]
MTRPTQTVWPHFCEVVQRDPEAPAAIDGEDRWTYRHLSERSTSLARALLAHGVRRGEHVAALLRNCPEWLAVQLAVMQVGAVLVPVNTRYKVEELAYCLRQSDSVLFFTMPEFVGINYHAMLGEIISRVGDAALPKLRQVVSLGHEPFPGGMTLAAFEGSGQGVSASHLEARRAAVTPDDLALIIYTSGTTGVAKGAMHDQGQVLLSALRLSRTLAPTDRILVLGPYFHIMGFSYGVNGPLHAGAATVVLATFNAQRALEIIEREGVTMVSGTPTMYQMMMARPEFARRDRSTLRVVYFGGAPATPALIEEIMRQFPGARVSTGFGMSETMGASAALPGDTPEQLATTLGVLHDYLEGRIVEPQTGEDVPPGVSGELWLRGLNVTRGYYNLPEETARAITPDGWLRTGDLFAQEPDSHLRMTGRLKEMYIRGGSNVYPAEVENFLHRHPDIEQVWLVGVPDDLYGEVGMAFVELRPGADLTAESLKAYCKGRIAGYKIPRYVHFTDQFPLTASGKVRKQELRQEGCRLLGLKLR